MPFSPCRFLSQESLPMSRQINPLESGVAFAVRRVAHGFMVRAACLALLGSFRRSFPTLVLRQTPTAASVKVSRPFTAKPGATEPYSSLVADRLKLSGGAQWGPSPWAPARSRTSCCAMGRCLVAHPDVSKEDKSEVACLARKWDSSADFVRIFNCYKNQSCDGQIGDGRGRNYAERALRGPPSPFPQLFHCLGFTASQQRAPFAAASQIEKISIIRSDALIAWPSRMLCSRRCRLRTLREHKLCHAPVPSMLTSFTCWGLLPLACRGTISASKLRLRLTPACSTGVCLIRLRNLRPGGSSGSLVQGLVIDDYYAVSVEPASADPMLSRSFAWRPPAKHIKLRAFTARLRKTLSTLTVPVSQAPTLTLLLRQVAWTCHCRCSQAPFLGLHLCFRGV